jgi:hypothetical protein
MSASDKIADFTISKLNSIFDTVSHALPTATKYALEVTSIDCLVTILYGLEFTVLASVTTGFVFWGYRTARRIQLENHYDDREVPYIFGAVCGTIIGFILWGVALSSLLNFWAWVGIFHPDLYLIHLAVQKVTN